MFLILDSHCFHNGTYGIYFQTKGKMYVSKSINADHKDLIHDVAYDFYGRRMATCSSDQTVKVWDQDDTGRENLDLSFYI